MVDDQKITTATLTDGSTFRVGDHVLQLVVTTRKE
jgi:hypothetical protein